MEPDDSLTCLPQPAICPHLEPISPTHTLNRFHEDQFFLYYAPIYDEVLQVATYHFNHLSLTECNSGTTQKIAHLDFILRLS